MKRPNLKILFQALGGVFLLGFLTWIAFWNSSKHPLTQIDKTSSFVEKKIVLRFGHNTPVQSALHQAALRFADEVKRKSQGKIEIEVFPAQELGSDDQMIEMARKGELDIVLTPTAKMSVAIPSMQYADLPFFFPSREDVYAMLDGEPGQMLLDDLNSIDLIGVTFWENGFKHFTGNKPYLSPDDFKGKKIRVMKSRIIIDQFNSFGAEAVVIDFHTTKQALADKVVDGHENPLVAIVGMGFHEVQSHITLSEHAYLGYVFSFSKKSFSNLPLDVQLMLIKTAKEITPWEREETQKREKKFIETIKNAGVIIKRLSPSDREKFAQKTAHIPKHYEEIIGANIISKTHALLLEKYGPSPKEKSQIIIGINVDLSMDGKVAGLAIKRGAELAIDEINAKGGVLGKKLKILTKDHRAIGSMGVKNVEEFVKRDDVVAIIGGLHSAVIMNEIKTIQTAKIPYLVPWANASNIIENGYEDNYLFRLSSNNKYITAKLAAFALHHYRKPAIIVENSLWGRENLQRINAYFKEHGLTPAVSIVYNRGQNSFSKEREQLKKSGADSILLIANSNEGSRLFQELDRENAMLPIISHGGIGGGKFFEENEALLKKSEFYFLQSFSFDKDDKGHAQELAKAYLDTYGIKDSNKIGAVSGVVHAHDLVHLLALAIEKAGSTDRIKVKKALEKLPPYRGVVKHYPQAFTVNNHEALNENDFYMVRLNKEGNIIAVQK